MITRKDITEQVMAKTAAKATIKQKLTTVKNLFQKGSDPRLEDQKKRLQVADVSRKKKREDYETKAQGQANSPEGGTASRITKAKQKIDRLEHYTGKASKTYDRGHALATRGINSAKSLGKSVKDKYNTLKTDGKAVAIGGTVLAGGLALRHLLKKHKERKMRKYQRSY